MHSERISRSLLLGELQKSESIEFKHELSYLPIKEVPLPHHIL